MCYVAKVACVLSVYSCSFQRHLLRNKIPQKTVSSLMLGGWGGGAISINHIFTISHITLNELLIFLWCHTETAPHSVREQAGNIFSALCEQTRAWVSGGSFIIYR